MFFYEKVLLSRFPTAQANLSLAANVVNSGSPSRILRVLRISFGMTILPKSSTRRTMPVAFIFLPLLVVISQWYCLQENPDYAAGFRIWNVSAPKDTFRKPKTPRYKTQCQLNLLVLIDLCSQAQLFPDGVLCMYTALFYYRYSDRTPLEMEYCCGSG